MTTEASESIADDVEVTRRILAHIDARTTDEGEGVRIPIAHYVDPAHFERELRVLRASPSVFAPSAAIANHGDHVERVAFGVPLFAVRDRDRKAHVFRNACRHRGVALVSGRGCSRALVCPYHGWTYRLDGSLSHVPHAHGFPRLDVSTRGLVEVPSRELDGLIVIDAVAPLSGADEHIAQLHDGSAWRDKLAPSTCVVRAGSTVRAINWKVLVEQFLEGYHIRSTHRTSFYPLQYDNLNIVETFGANSRVTYPFRNIERLRDRPESTWAIKHRVTFLYQLFPNVMVATFPGQVLVIVVDPIDVGHSTMTVYVLREPSEREPTAPADGQASVLDRGVAEDNAMSAAVQRGLFAGANEFLEFGRHESAIGHFHRTLAARMSALA
jgi:choline monooxygenase